MAVYVDKLRQYKWKLGKSCHLVADSLVELHLFAGIILEMRPEWFQVSRGGIPHYDLSEKRRKRALKFGAKEVSGAEYFKILRAIRINYFIKQQQDAQVKEATHNVIQDMYRRVESGQTVSIDGNELRSIKWHNPEKGETQDCEIQRWKRMIREAFDISTGYDAVADRYLFAKLPKLKA